ncbi:hypothetical protein K1719_017015 [Acacia pycnantha]|nr:hypothetical protein K1719_017015 [Acacia pycnantha]
MSSHPRSLSWIVVSLGGLAVFLILASWVLVSPPIGSYLYGVDSVEKFGLPVSPINNSFTNVNSNETLDLVHNNVSSDLQSPTVSSSYLPINTNREHNHALANSSVTFHESTSPKSPKTKEINGLENSAAAANPQALDVPLVSREDAVNTSLSIHSNTSSPADSGNNSPDVTSNIRINEHASVDLINESRITSTSSNGNSTPPDSRSKSIPASSDAHKNASILGLVDSGCDLYHGNWIHDPSGPLYTNSSCPIITQMQNCRGNGRPDKDYENWRWKPFQCDLPRFDPKKFLELMRGKTLAFIGDSVARNQMESMLCILWQVEVPKNRGNRNMQRYYFRSTSVMIVRIWSSWLVKVTNEPFDFAPAGVDKLHLDATDEKLMNFILTFDVVVISSGHWFAKKSVYILNNEIVGGQLWWPEKSRPMKVNNKEAYGISVETILTALVNHPNYTGLTILRSYSPDHYEGGAWNTGGSCTGKLKPLASGEMVKNEHTDTMHGKQVDGFNLAMKKARNNKSKLVLMDITDAFQYRHDGHPGPYRSPDPNKITKRGPDGRPPPQDCLHWCMPGPVDTWNELVLEIIQREYNSGRSP